MGSLSDLNHTTGTRDASRYFWVCMLEIERATHSLGLERQCTRRVGYAQTFTGLFAHLHSCACFFHAGKPVRLSALSPGSISMSMSLLE